jgi:hypothetical protein
MFALLSPAKRFREGMDVPEWVSKTRPLFCEKTSHLVDILKGYDEASLSALMGLSEKLSRLNVERYLRFEEQEVHSALYFFGGDTYVGFDVGTMDKDGWDYGVGFVRILSGLYGILRPGDEVRAYRLEMGTKLGGKGGLYGYWGEAVTDYLVRESGGTVLNLASREYASAVDTKRLRESGVRWLDFVFYDELASGERKVVGLFSKKARGMFARAVVEHRMDRIDDLKGLRVGGYDFDEGSSEEDRWVFFRSKED